MVFLFCFVFDGASLYPSMVWNSLYSIAFLPLPLLFCSFCLLFQLHPEPWWWGVAIGLSTALEL